MKVKLEDFDHPLVFLFFFSMALIGFIGLLGLIAQRFGVLAPGSLLTSGANS